jgi:hypothetical protein
MPSTMMTLALAAGRSWPHVATRGSHWPSRLPLTNRSPTVVSTPTSPRLDPTIRTIPRAARLMDTTVRSRASTDAIHENRAGQQRQRPYRHRADPIEALTQGEQLSQLHQNQQIRDMEEGEGRQPDSGQGPRQECQGWWMVRLVSPGCGRIISGPRKRMESAIAAASGGSGAQAYPSVAQASVML